MDLSFTSEQVQLRHSIRKMLQRHGEANADNSVAHEVPQDLLDMGLLELALVPEDSGIDDGLTSMVVVFEELGRYQLAEPFLSLFLGARLRAPTIKSQTAAVQQCLGTPHAVAIYEPETRYCVNFPAAQAKTTASGFVLNGRKVAVSSAGLAERLIVSAQLSGTLNEHVSLFSVDAKQHGVEVLSYPSIDGGEACSVLLRNVELGSDALLSQGETAAWLIADHVQVACMLLSAEALGLMERVLALTVDYCKERRQFDQPIGKFQVIQHRLADVYIACESIRSLLYAAVAKYSESSRDTGQAIAALKFKVGELGRMVAETAVQLHGAVGFTEEYVLGRYYKRLLVIDALCGNADHQLQIYINGIEHPRTMNVGENC